MIKVSIAEVAKAEEKEGCVVVLVDEAGQRCLPILIGAFEGERLAAGLCEVSFPRPLTYDFIVRLLQAGGVELEEVRIEALKESTFYAVARVRNGETVREVDGRPSDAMALAVRTGSPIYVAEEVWKEGGQEIPEEGRKMWGESPDSLVREWRSRK